MKFLVFLTLVAAAAANLPHAAIISTGHSSQHRTQDNHGNYAFGYKESHKSGGSFREEKGDGHSMIGSYGLQDADGRMRTVNYVADGHGFRASIHTNEPGTSPKDSAAASYNGADLAHVAAPIAHAGPIYGKGIIAAAPAIAAPAIAYGGYGHGGYGGYGHGGYGGHLGGAAYSFALNHGAIVAAPAIAKTYVAAAPIAYKGYAGGYGHGGYGGHY